MVHEQLFSQDIEMASSRPDTSPYEERLRLLLAVRVRESKKEDYFGYLVPTMMVGPMLGYGTRLEPLLALGIGGCWGIYAAVHFFRASRRRDRPAN